MRSSRVFQGMIAGASALALLFAGCERDDDAEADEDEEQEAEEGEEAAAADDEGAEVSDPTPVEGAGMPEAASYSVFPESSEFVGGIAFEPVRQSALWDRYWETMLAAVDTDDGIGMMQEACGFEPFSQIQNVMFGGDPESEDEMVVVVEGFSRDEVTNCVEGIAELDVDEEVEVEEDGDFLEFRDGDGEGILVGWLDDRTLVTGEGDKEWLEARIEGEDGLASDAPLAQIVETEVDKGSGVWFGLVPDEDGEMASEMAMAGGPEPNAIFGSVAPSDGLSVSVGLRFDSGDEAEEVLNQTRQMLEMVRAQAGELGAVIDNAEMRVEDSDMLVSLALSEQELTEVVEGVGEMFGGMAAGLGEQAVP